LIRQLFAKDDEFRLALREMNRKFYHGITTSAQVEVFWSEKLKRDLSPLFDQYLRDLKIPTLQVKRDRNKLVYRWSDCNDRFNLPVRIYINGKATWLEASTSWKEMKLEEQNPTVTLDKNFYVGFQLAE
jgi:aminopeptidase N